MRRTLLLDAQSTPGSHPGIAFPPSSGDKEMPPKPMKTLTSSEAFNSVFAG
jgi:hypothetical protein